MTDPSHRIEFLDRIRTALRNKPKSATPLPDESEAVAAFSTKAERARKRSREDRIALAQGLDATGLPARMRVHVVTSIDEVGPILAQVAAEHTPEWSEEKTIVAWDHPLVAQALPSVKAALPDASVTTCVDDPEHFDAKSRSSFIGITSADYVVADSTTMVLFSRPGQPRATSLLPSIHVAIVTLNELCADYGELYCLLHEKHAQDGLPNSFTFVSGPSKTADIEAVMVHGAHGPREARLFVVLEP